jgi:hypothetical protein
MKKLIFVLSVLFFIMNYSASGQLAIGYSIDGNTLALSTNPLNKLRGEFRVNTKEYNQASWSYSDRGITQAYILVSIFSSGKASLYTGAGTGINLLSESSDKWVSVNIPLGLRMNPFPSLPNLFIFGEYDPMIILKEDTPIIHSVSLGFRYRLGKDL